MHVIINLFKNVDIPKRFLNFPIPYKFITAVQEINAILGQSQIENISYTLNLINSNNMERLETIKKNNISKESLLRVAELYNITIPEEHFQEKKKTKEPKQKKRSKKKKNNKSVW